MKITKENFRKILSRARKSLHGFMNEKCGLIKPDNPCQCSKKTMAWIRNGLVNPENLQFSNTDILKIKDIAEQKTNAIEKLLDNEYAQLYREHPFYDGDSGANLPPIPVETCHPFWMKVATYSG